MSLSLGRHSLVPFCHSPPQFISFLIAVQTGRSWCVIACLGVKHAIIKDEFNWHTSGSDCHELVKLVSEVLLARARHNATVAAGREQRLRATSATGRECRSFYLRVMAHRCEINKSLLPFTENGGHATVMAQWLMGATRVCPDCGQRQSPIMH